MSKKTQDDLVRLANKYSPRIVCGLLSGEKKLDAVIVEEFYPIPTRCGPKIHFKPSWDAYRDVKNRIHEIKKSFVGEFHTHPDGMEELNINDRKILRKLGGGFWVIVTLQRVVPWYFKHIDKSKDICERVPLEIK